MNLFVQSALGLTKQWTTGILPGSNGHSATCKYEFRSKKEVRLFLGKIEDTHGNDGGYKFLRKFNDTIRISLRDDHAKKKGDKLHLMLCDQSSLFASSYLHMSINVSSCSKDTQKDKEYIIYIYIEREGETQQLPIDRPRAVN